MAADERIFQKDSSAGLDVCESHFFVISSYEEWTLFLEFYVLDFQSSISVLFLDESDGF
jgi:hypothetical protein